MKQVEFEYYKKNSQNRYSMTHLTHLTPFNKEYTFTSIKEIPLSELKAQSNPISELIFNVINNSIKINRFDILSRYQDHNDSPSVRNLHSCKIMFLLDGFLYYYDIYKEKLLLLDNTKIEGVFSKEKLYIIGFTDLLNISRYYSEFSLYLSLLDAGHVLFNIKNTLLNLKKSIIQHIEVVSHPILNNINQKDSVFFPFIIELDRPNGKLELINKESNTINILKYKNFDEFASTDLLKKLLDLYNRNEEVKKINIPHTPGILNVGLRRSAHTLIGNFNLSDIPNYSIVELGNEIKKYKSQLSSSKIQFSIIHKQNDSTVILTEDSMRTNCDVEFSEILYNDHEFFDLSTYFTIVVCYSTHQAVIEDGMKAVLLSAAEIMQIASWFAAKKNHPFRPMKNHNDEYLKNILCLDDSNEINFIGVFCNEPIEQISFNL